MISSKTADQETIKFLYQQMKEEKNHIEIPGSSKFLELSFLTKDGMRNVYVKIELSDNFADYNGSYICLFEPK